MDKIKLRFLKCRLDDIDCEFADLGLVALDPAAGKALADETPVPGVVRWVELHDRAPGLGLLGVHLLKADALRRSEGLDIATYGDCVVIAKDRPEARPVVLFGPMNRIFGP